MKRLFRWLAVLLIAALCALPLLEWAGARLNVTSSFPPGVYWVVDKPPGKGDLVRFCPPDTAVFRLGLMRGYLPGGPCPGGSMYMIKRLVGTAGDEVMLGPDGVSVNGVLLVHSRLLQDDPSGRPMPTPANANYRLQAGEVLVMSEYSPLSFDGRYFGPIAAARLEEVVRPVWVWEKSR